MRHVDTDDRLSSFEDELRSWGGRPPRTAASVGRQRVTARLPLARRPIPWLRLAASVALLVVVVMAAWVGGPGRSDEGALRAGVAAATLADADVVVWVMDPTTTVYFVLGPSGSAQGGVS